MSLTTGTRLGPYEIIAPIGAGGMGEVYRARDTKLGRDVAIKVLPESFAHDAERMARFEREANVLASLNHPHIATIHRLEESNDIRALVMELVEGPTLAERIGHRAMPLDEALPIAKQIAEGLEYAHERGIIHRDLKPANVKLTTDGNVKILDFGLAKALETPTPQGNPSISPTLTLEGTRAGVILGTAAYMAPEQARGAIVDKRADIWAFGVVLYEMLTGEPPFAGPTVSDTLAAVLRAEPEWGSIPTSMRRLVRRCLEKNPKQRLRDIGDARIVIEEAVSGASPEREATGVTAPQKRNLMPWAVAVGLGLALVGTSWLAWRATRPVERSLVRLNVDLGPDAVAGQFTTAVISPDGSRLVFPSKSPDGKQLLATRLLGESRPTLLPGTENGRDPFFSPDGQGIGFFADEKMKKISIQGGAPVELCDAPNARGAGWGEDGNIVAALNTYGALTRVAAEGGTPQRITTLTGEASTHRWPQPLPGNESVLFTISASAVVFEEASIAAASLKTGEIKILVRGGYFGRYLATSDSTGHLVYVHEGVLFAVPFDPARLELRGAAVPLLEDFGGDPTSGAGQFSFSGAHAGPWPLVYRSGRVSYQSFPIWWLDSSGKTKPLIATPGFYSSPRFSPDGQRMALIKRAGNDQGSIFVYDWQRDTMSRLAFKTQQPTYPIWSPDGAHIVFRFRSSDGFSLGWLRADGSGEIQHLLDGKNQVTPYSFFPDGRRLAYAELNPDSGFHVWTLALDVSDPDHPKPGKPELFLRTSLNETHPAVSPDGHWIAYQSAESGRYEVYVRPFPGPGGKWQISSAGGRLPVWSRDGRALFFQNLDSRIMAADCEPKNESVAVGKPRLWSDQPLHYLNEILNYDLAPDGKRFAIFPELTAPAEEKGNVHMTFLLNFFDELRRRAPAGGK